MSYYTAQGSEKIERKKQSAVQSEKTIEKGSKESFL